MVWLRPFDGTERKALRNGETEEWNGERYGERHGRRLPPFSWAETLSHRNRVPLISLAWPGQQGESAWLPAHRKEAPSGIAAWCPESKIVSFTTRRNLRFREPHLSYSHSHIV